ncbi:hypothetical protein [Paraclostridium sordellii]|uniref:hypothetical protein n=1 Tax=Paraclostridium sordellii TaxID=1505 RepID=UPI0022E71755|nr:hypothetical protein [Paeniclostridium sordellii]
MNFRYFNNVPIIISCEMGIDEILDIDEAVGSRLYEMSKSYLVKMEGNKLNYRIYR